MNEEQINNYRKILEKDFSDKDLEIETTLSYISVGSLGFFITINEKFLRIQAANYKFVLIISLIFLFLSFVLILIRKSRTTHHDLIMMGKVDSMNPDSEEQDQDLQKIWDKSHKELRRILKFIYYSLSIGIGMQVIFVILNF